eukprot:799942-Karenia_brevis.AAC.1
MRTLPIQRSPSGDRHRALRDILDQEKMTDVTDWPLKGPRTVGWVLRFCLTQSGGGPLARVQQYM